MVVAAAFANLLPIQNPLQLHLLASYQAPSAAHWFGTDQLGRDQFARSVYGARISLIVGFSATALAAVVGGAAGLIGGYLQGVTETTIMGLMDVLLAFPGFVLALALTSFLGASVRNVIVAITVLSIPVFARLTRSVTLSLSQRDFVQVARTLGTPTWRIL
ncbi:MAG TPA: ABC transporter permease, partial [Acidimicrobiales bacterium]|nr:ABC transporter permease [Acidimicrobiales bacterium]